MAAATHDDAQRRALLFGARAEPGTYRRAGAGAGGGAGGDGELLEQNNVQQVDGLRGQVRQMRHLAIDIGQEVRDQNAMLDAMHGTFDEGALSVRRTIGELRRLARSGGGAHVCAMALFALAFFVLIYLLLRR